MNFAYAAIIIPHPCTIRTHENKKTTTTKKSPSIQSPLLEFLDRCILQHLHELRTEFLFKDLIKFRLNFFRVSNCYISGTIRIVEYIVYTIYYTVFTCILERSRTEVLLYKANDNFLNCYKKM